MSSCISPLVTNLVIIATPYDVVFIDLSQQPGFTFLIPTLTQSNDTGSSHTDLAYRESGASKG
jgi:hypothetical protein